MTQRADFIIPECYIDTNLVETLKCTQCGDEKPIIIAVFCRNRGYNRKNLYLEGSLIAGFCTYKLSCDEKK